VIELHPHTAFTPEIEDVPDWRRADLDHVGSTPLFVLQPQSLAEMSCDELHESVLRHVHDLEQAVEQSRRVRTALGDED
jgi:hypothetical protein